MWIAFHRFPAIFEVLVPQFYLGFTHGIIPETLLNHSNSFHRLIYKSELKLDTNLLICSFGHCECDSHTVHKLSLQHLTTNLLAPWESECSRMHSKVSPDWLPSDIKATWSVLEIFKMAGYFPAKPHISNIRLSKYQETFQAGRNNSYLLRCKLFLKLTFCRHLILHGDITNNPRHGVWFLVLHSTVNKQNTT